MKFKDYSFQSFDKCDNEEVAELQKLHWGPNIVDNEQHLKWKYYDNPYCVEPIAYTVKHNKSLVGFMGLIPTRWRIGESSIDLLSFADAIIHPDHRGKGLYPHLINSLIDEVEGSRYYGFLNLSNNAITSHVMEKMGFRSLMKKSYFKRIDYYNILINYVKKRKYEDYYSDNIKFSLSPDIDEMLSYDEKTMKTNKIQLFKDSSFYNWRYGSKRRQYHFFHNYHDGKLVAYVVLLFDKKRSARIIDFTYDKSQYLLEIMEKIIKKNNYRLIYLMDANIDNDLRIKLKKYKFLKNHFHDYLIKNESDSYIWYKPIESSINHDFDGLNRSISNDFSSWDIKEIASDGV